MHAAVSVAVAAALHSRPQQLMIHHSFNHSRVIVRSMFPREVPVW